MTDKSNRIDLGEPTKIPCKPCRGEGKLTINGRKCVCDHCKGRGYTTTYWH